MNVNQQFDEDDYALHAMHLLGEPEASALAAQLSESEEARARLAEVEAQLGLFALGAVEMHPVPEGSLDRLMQRVASERQGADGAAPRSGTARLFAVEQQPERRRRLLPWVGWAVAALLALTTGKLVVDRRSPGPGEPAVRSSDLAQAGEIQGLRRQRDESQSQAAKQTEQMGRLHDEIARLKERQAILRERVTQAVSDAAAGKALLEQQTALAQTSDRAREQMSGTLAAQASQIEELTRQARSAQEVLAVLTDRSALRVALAEPKHQPAPTGQATYLAGRGTLVFDARHLAPLAAKKVYELWLLPADGSAPVPAGTFTPDAQGNASVVTSGLRNAVPAKGFGVTIEEEGGAQSPTLPILLLGTSGA